MGFLSDVVEAMFFRTDSLQYWHASLYGLNAVRGEIKNTERLKEHEAIAYEILLPRGGGQNNFLMKLLLYFSFIPLNSI